MFPKGTIFEEMVLNIDLAPTFLELSGVALHSGMHGVSFKEHAIGKKPIDWRKLFLAYYRKELGDTPTCHGIRTEDAKLIVYPGHPKWTEVSGLKNDLYELHNLPAAGPLANQLKSVLDS
jgi:arylsulfatase A-like enzyme